MHFKAFGHSSQMKRALFSGMVMINNLRTMQSILSRKHTGSDLREVLPRVFKF